MARLFRNDLERKKGLWRTAVDIALADVRVITGGLDVSSLEQLEETLLAADFGVHATLRLTDRVERSMRRGEVSGAVGVMQVMKDEICEILRLTAGSQLALAESGPTVYLMVGVNGVGKTTSIAKVANHLIQEGRSVMVVAADTYRAGAIKQLEVWANRVGADCLRGQEGGDPAAVAYDALEAAAARGTDVVLIDTAGRLHTNRGLMEELTKIGRVVGRRVEGAPHETLMVLDATVGQNAIRQVEAFRKAIHVSGILLAKLDSSSRGGIVVALHEEYGIPVKLIGTGEGLGDLEAFHADTFVEAVFGR